LGPNSMGHGMPNRHEQFCLPRLCWLFCIVSALPSVQGDISNHVHEADSRFLRGEVKTEAQERILRLQDAFALQEQPLRQLQDAYSRPEPLRNLQHDFTNGGTQPADGGDVITADGGDSDSSIPKDFGRIGEDSAAPKTIAKGLWPHKGVHNDRKQAELDEVYNGLKNNEKVVALRLLPPVPLNGGPLAVGVRIKLVKFVDIDEVVGTASLVLDLTLFWADDRLSSFTRQFHTGDQLAISSDLVWTPDIVVLNQVSEFHSSFATSQVPLVLADEKFKEETNANVIWTRRINLVSRCDLDISNFPFDTQMCPIIVGSWSASRRQMMLIDQNSHRHDAASQLHTSEFLVKNITVFKRNMYMRKAAERFEEIQYDIVLQRYPHFYILNFMLPMLAVTMLTVATMWMNTAGVRMNSASRLLLCIVQIMNMTSSWRPAKEADIWLDRFQSHCLALTMGSVLQSLVMDYLTEAGFFVIPWFPKPYFLDTLLRTAVCLVTILVFAVDLCELVKQNDMRSFYTKFHSHSSRLVIGFVYVIFSLLGASSALSFMWLLLPQELWRKLCCLGCSVIAAGAPASQATTRASDAG